MAESLIGTWKCVATENLDNYMKEIGIGFAQRKLGSSLKPTVTISFDSASGKWTINSDYSITVIKACFKINEEFEDQGPDGKPAKLVVKLDGNKFVHTQRNAKATYTVIREVNAKDEMVVTLLAGDVTSTRVFKRI